MTAEVDGYRFLLRRLEHAMVRRDVRMLHDPMRAQSRSLLAGAIVGVLVLAGAAIVALLRPQGSIGDANIVVGMDSGALYAVVDDTLHPVLNLASARLITGSAESPTSVKDAKLATMPRGPILGIPGAPAALPGGSAGDRSTWTLCESAESPQSGSGVSTTGVTTTVLSSRPVLGDDTRAQAGDEALLVRHGSETYLVYDGKRAEIDLGNSAVVRSLKLQGIKPRPIGTGLLDATVEVAPLAPPTIAQAGLPAGGRLAGVRIGAVVKVSGVDQSELYVVVSSGVQRVSPLAAQIIRNADSQGMSDVKALPPDALDGIPMVDPLPIDQFPADTMKILAVDDNPVACMTWSRAAGDGAAQKGLLVGRRVPLAATAHPVDLATADGVGERVDAVYVPPSSGEFVQVTGIEPNSARRESLYYIADNGVRYGVPDQATATTLGLGDRPRLAPWQIVKSLVPGPTLTKSDALISRDAIPEAPAAG